MWCGRCVVNGSVIWEAKPSDIGPAGQFLPFRRRSPIEALRTVSTAVLRALGARDGKI